MSQTAFDTSQFRSAYPRGIEHHYWIEARHQIVLARLRELPLAANDIVLDVGCGSGLTVAFLRMHGIDARGFDPGHASVVISAEDFCLHASSLDTLPSEWRGARAVLLLDVIEHLDAPVELLFLLSRALPTLRYLVVTVPSSPELWSNYDEYYGHRKRYRETDLTCELELAGWQITRLESMFGLLYGPARLLAALGWRRKVVLEAPRWHWPHRLLASWLAERVGPGIRGTSLLAVAVRAVEAP